MWLVRWSGLRPLKADSLWGVPESAGLYLLWSQKGDGTLECCHAGETQSIRLALASHLSAVRVGETDPRPPGLMFEFALLPNPLLRQGAARFLRRWYRIEGTFEEGILIPVNPPVREMHTAVPPGRSGRAVSSSDPSDRASNSPFTYPSSGVPRHSEPNKENTLTA